MLVCLNFPHLPTRKKHCTVVVKMNRKGKRRKAGAVFEGCCNTEVQTFGLDLGGRVEMDRFKKYLGLIDLTDLMLFRMRRERMGQR